MSTTPTFRTVLRGAVAGQEVIPLLRAYLHNPTFQSFNVKIREWEEREPDGWFHPSTHPVWTERMLYYYLTAPDRLVREPMESTGVLAVTAGSFWHVVLQTWLVDAGVLVRRPEVCECGMPNPSRAEVHAQDDEVGSRGHGDGLLHSGKGLEIKTAHPYKKAMRASDLQTLIDTEPGYYHQAQDYMRMRGWEVTVLLWFVPWYPFEMQEIPIPYNPKAALAVRDKYLRVRQAVADGRVPEPCCAPRSAVARACVARATCPIGLM